MASKRKRLQGKAASWMLKRIQRWLRKKPYLEALKKGEQLGRVIWRIAKRRRKTGESNLRMAFPQMSESEARDTCHRVFENFGRASADFLIGLDRTKEEIEATTVIEGIEYVDAALAKGKGVILITAHFGNWERIAAWGVLSGYKLSVIARDADAQGVNKLVNELREGPGTEVISRGKAARASIERLRRNEIVGILPDQNSKEVFIPFFGKPAGTVLGPGVLAERTGATVQPVFCHYEGNGRYRAVFYPPVVADEGYEMKGEGMMRAINRLLEEVIREHPDQWLWFHDRWRNARKKGLL
ncbi:MAG: lysophospholipid acyltransferase family protein [Fimbriimonadaceae bacterium]